MTEKLWRLSLKIWAKFFVEKSLVNKPPLNSSNPSIWTLKTLWPSLKETRANTKIYLTSLSDAQEDQTNCYVSWKIRASFLCTSQLINSFVLFLLFCLLFIKLLYLKTMRFQNKISFQKTLSPGKKFFLTKKFNPNITSFYSQLNPSFFNVFFLLFFNAKNSPYWACNLEDEISWETGNTMTSTKDWERF